MPISEVVVSMDLKCANCDVVIYTCDECNDYFIDGENVHCYPDSHTCLACKKEEE